MNNPVAHFLFIFNSFCIIENEISNGNSNDKKNENNRIDNNQILNPNHNIDYLHVTDAAMALWKLVFSRESGVFNIGSGDPTTPFKVANEIVSISKSKSKILPHLMDNPQPNFLVADTSRIRSLNWKPSITKS